MNRWTRLLATSSIIALLLLPGCVDMTQIPDASEQIADPHPSEILASGKAVLRKSVSEPEAIRIPNLELQLDPDDQQAIPMYRSFLQRIWLQQPELNTTTSPIYLDGKLPFPVLQALEDALPEVIQEQRKATHSKDQSPIEVKLLNPTMNRDSIQDKHYVLIEITLEKDKSFNFHLVGVKSNETKKSTTLNFLFSSKDGGRNWSYRIY